ncbi:hypothetical protein C8R46DRAFT_465479 [Mycena filopes]|nr:hypothetical protein C8R46DRAFT_465479 [Mycena filopes]
MASSDIYIRKFRPSDHPQVRKLLFEGFVTGKGSMLTTVKLRYLYQAPALTSYFLAGGGAYTLWVLPAEVRTSAPALAAIVLLLMGLAAFIALQMTLTSSLRGFCDKALETDLRDIPAHYAAPSVFLVAVRPAAAATVEGADKLAVGEEVEEVLGFVGLEFKSEKDPKPAELRRIVVSPHHRRRGLASRLLLEALKHGETVRGMQTVKVGASQYQPGARKLFEKLGWVRVGQTESWVGVINLYIARYERPVKAVKTVKGRK